MVKMVMDAGLIGVSEVSDLEKHEFFGKYPLFAWSNDTVNINGSLNNIETTNLEITDKLITLNKGLNCLNISKNYIYQIFFLWYE